jgi:hypothetical protein
VGPCCSSSRVGGRGQDHFGEAEGEQGEQGDEM